MASNTPTSELSAHPGAVDLDPRRWKALGVVLLASFMILLDISIVNVAIPSIQSDLHTSFASIEWVIAAYQLAYALTLITGGRLGDIFGRKRLFMLGVAGFTLASAACGLAQSGNFLIGARVAQGFMAALMYPQVFAVIQVNFPPRERGKAFGIIGAIIGLATITGPLLGGLLIQGDLFGLHWRPIFLVNVPVGIVALTAAVFLLHESKAPSAPRLDMPGVVIATIGLFLLAYPLVEGRSAGWPVWAFAMMLGAIPVFVGFALYNARRARTIGSPLVEPALFGDRAFVVGLLVTFVFISGVPAFFLTFSIFLQVGHGFTALATGLTTLPFAVASSLASGMSIKLAPKLGKTILQVGATLIVIGMAAVWLTVHLIGANNFEGYYLIPALAIAGLGMGCVIAPLINIVLSGIHHGHAGSASGVLTTVQQVGGAIGVAIVGVIFFGLLSSHAGDVSSARSTGFQAQLVGLGLPPVAAGRAAQAFDQCFADRSAASDPSQSPPSCNSLRPPAGTASTQQQVAAQAFADEGRQRLADDFTFSFTRSLIYNLVAWSITFGLIFLLPKKQSGRPQADPAAGH